MPARDGLVGAAIDGRAGVDVDPRIGRHVGDAVVATGEIFDLLQAAIQHAQQAINLGLVRECERIGAEFAFPTRTVQLQWSGALSVALQERVAAAP